MLKKAISALVFTLLLILMSASFGYAKECLGTIKTRDVKLVFCNFNPKHATIEGTVKNISNIKLTEITVYFSLYNKEGALIERKSVRINSVEPNKVQDFLIEETNDQAVDVSPTKIIAYGF